MSKPVKERKRSVNIDKLSEKEVERISNQIGDKLREIADKACDEANNILKIYGLKTQLQFLQPYPINKDKKE